MEYESVLEDGTRILFRPIHPEDKGRLQQGLQELSAESRYRRFFRYVDHFSHDQLAYLTEVDFDHHVAWIAVLKEVDGEPGVGVARWVRLKDEPTVAEAAVAVIDAFHHRGIGTTLLWLLTHSAIEKGVCTFRSWVMADNRDAIDLIRSLGAQPGKIEQGVLEFNTPLPESIDDLDKTPAPLILRAVATGAIEAEGQPATRTGTLLR